MSLGSSENDHYLRITADGKPHVLSYEELAAAEVAGEDDVEREKRLQKEVVVGKEVEDARHRMLAAGYEEKLRAADGGSKSGRMPRPLGKRAAAGAPAAGFFSSLLGGSLLGGGGIPEDTVGEEKDEGSDGQLSGSGSESDSDMEYLDREGDERTL